MTNAERCDEIERKSEHAVPSLWYVSDDDFKWLLAKARTCVVVEELCALFNSAGTFVPRKDSPFYRKVEHNGV